MLRIGDLPAATGATSPQPDPPRVQRELITNGCAGAGLRLVGGTSALGALRQHVQPGPKGAASLFGGGVGRERERGRVSRTGAEQQRGGDQA